jgi:hypothetical protein
MADDDSTGMDAYTYSKAYSGTYKQPRLSNCSAYACECGNS